METGVTKNQVKIPLNVEKNVVSDGGGLDIQLASTLIPEITASAQQVLQNDDLPFTEPTASQLIVAANMQILSKKWGVGSREWGVGKKHIFILGGVSSL